MTSVHYVLYVLLSLGVVAAMYASTTSTTLPLESADRMSAEEKETLSVGADALDVIEIPVNSVAGAAKEKSDMKGKEVTAAVPKPNPEHVTPSTQSSPLVRAPEFSGIAGFINADPSFSMESLRGKVVVTFFWTYTCINCQRTIPAVVALYEKYKDQGLVVVGVHTPEFAFEKNIDNVRAAVKEWGMNFPVLLDNDYATWRAYNNSYWPNRYVIDKEGNVQFSTAGEGNHDAIEKVVQLLLTK